MAIYMRGRGFELGTTVNREGEGAVREGLELGSSELRVQRSNHSASLLPITQP